MARYNQANSASTKFGTLDRPISGIFGEGNVRFFKAGLTNFKAPASVMRVRMWTSGYWLEGFGPGTITGYYAGSFAMGVVRNVPINSNIPIDIFGYTTGVQTQVPTDRVLSRFGDYMGINASQATVGSVTPDIFNLGGRGICAGAASMFGAGAGMGTTAGNAFYHAIPATGGAGRGGGGSVPVGSNAALVYVNPSNGFTGTASLLIREAGGTQSDPIVLLKVVTPAEHGQIGIDYIGTGGGGYVAGANGGGTDSGDAGFPGGQCNAIAAGSGGGRPGGGLVIVEW